MKKALPVLLQISTFSLLLLSLMFSSIGVRPAHAATTWTVTSLADDGTTAGTCPDVADCRLRKALSLATDGDTIVFDAALAGGTIYLADTLTIATGVIIDGSSLSTKLTLSGDSDNDTNADVRIMTVNSGITTTLDSLILTKGKAASSGGGAILNNGDLTLDNTAITYNVGGGVRNNDTLNITESSFTNNSTEAGGGAINNTGEVFITANSLFSNNTANVGGAIFNVGTLEVKGSTFSGNGSILAGGAINTTGSATIEVTTFDGNNAGSQGGAISSSSSNITITNSTFYANSATTKGGAIYSWVAGIAINSSTFSGNWAPAGKGGGIYNDGPMHITNTIIANSVAGGDCKNGSGTLGTNINNLVEDGSCAPAVSGDPKLGTPANNGGPTKTLGLMGGSPAIDAGNDAACAASPVSNFDQRGVIRPIGSHCDIGAFESRFTSVTYASNGAQDGWVLESSENSNTGLTINSANSTLLVGDDNAKKQYRGILSFNTAAIPDTAVVSSVWLKVKQYGIVGGGDPVSSFQGFMADIQTGMFGAAALETTDFQTAATASYGPFVSTPVNSWYSINLTNAKAHINKLTSNGGLTQIRLRFKLDDNNDTLTNYLSLFSGNAAAASKPQLVIQYYVP